jgi:hypothetical protein
MWEKKKEGEVEAGVGIENWAQKSVAGNKYCFRTQDHILKKHASYFNQYNSLI